MPNTVHNKIAEQRDIEIPEAVVVRVVCSGTGERVR